MLEFRGELGFVNIYNEFIGTQSRILSNSTKIPTSFQANSYYLLKHELNN